MLKNFFLLIFTGLFSSLILEKYGCQAVAFVGAILSGLCIYASTYANQIYIVYLTVGVGGGKHTIFFCNPNLNVFLFKNLIRKYIIFRHRLWTTLLNCYC